MKSRMPNTWFTEQVFHLVIGGGEWKTQELPPEVWDQMPEWLGGPNTVGLYSSGSASVPRYKGNIPAHAGIDLARHETRPVPGEPELNSYHWFIGAKKMNPESCRDEYPVYGPFKRQGTRVEHWHDLEELLDAYPLDGSHPDDPQ